MIRTIKIFSLLLLTLWLSLVNLRSQEYRTIAEGVKYAHFTKYVVTASDSARLPTLVHALRLDATKSKLQLLHAKDAAIGVEPTSSIVRRHNAFAGINAGFFAMQGLTAGDAAGVLQIGGRLLSEPYKERAACGIAQRNSTTTLVFGHLRWQGSVQIGALRFGANPEYSISGINRTRDTSEMVMFTPEFHRTTLTNPDGLEIVVENNLVRAVRDSLGSVLIPSGGVILSCSGAARRWARANVRVGMHVKISSVLEAAIPEQTRRFREATDIVGGVSLLLTNGVLNLSWKAEGATEEFARTRHPRTALGHCSDGNILLVVADGRQLGVSHGLTLEELAETLKELGATDAMNLDGGGSTTMVIDGAVVNKPSDTTGERSVSDVIVVFPRIKN